MAGRASVLICQTLANSSPTASWQQLAIAAATVTVTVTATAAASAAVAATAATADERCVCCAISNLTF